MSSSVHQKSIGDYLKPETGSEVISWSKDVLEEKIVKFIAELNQVRAPS